MVENITSLSIKYPLIISCESGLNGNICPLTAHFRPAYCNGQCSMLNYDTVHKIYEVAKQTDRNGFRLEGESETPICFNQTSLNILDVYFTGLLRQKAEIPLGVEHELEMAYCDEAETDDLLERVLDSGNFSLMRSEPRQ